MNQDDRHLIADLFERMHSCQGLAKDQEAEAFIHQSMRQNADSPYLLVQSVLAQEVALQKAEARIRELEAQVEQGSTAARSSAGFGAGEPAPWEAPKVAASGSGAGASGAPVGGAAALAQSASSLGSSAVPAAGRRRGGPSGDRVQVQRGSGGFMAQAMSTAAGVAGGMLLASGISSLFSGSDSSANASEMASSTASTTDTATNDVPTNDALDTTADQDAMQHASHEDDWGGDDWGGDEWGGDFEI